MASSSEYRFEGFNLARDVVHQTAVEHGWWEPQEVEIVPETFPVPEAVKFTARVQRNFGELLALVHSEVSEALEEHRDGHGLAETYAVCQECREIRKLARWPVGPHGWVCHGLALKPEGIPSELADIMIRVLDIAGYYGIDIEQAMLIKAKFNETREYLHGGKKI